MQFLTALHRFIMGTDKAASLLHTTFEEGEYSSRVSHCTAAPSPISEHKIEISYGLEFLTQIMFCNSCDGDMSPTHLCQKISDKIDNPKDL